MKLKSMEEMHDLTTAALRFVDELKRYAAGRGYLLLHDEPIIHLRTEDKPGLTITQSVYVSSFDIEFTVVGYLEKGSAQSIIMETTFDFQIYDSAVIHEIHEWLKELRGRSITHFFICVKGEGESSAGDEMSVIIRQVYRVGEEPFRQWDSCIELFRQAGMPLVHSMNG